MRQESLNKATDSILVALDKIDIDPTDKIELLINLKTMLNNVESYEEARDTLIQKTIRKKFIYDLHKEK